MKIPGESVARNLQSSIRPPSELNRPRLNSIGPSASPSPQGSTIFVWWSSETHENGRSMGGGGGVPYIYIMISRNNTGTHIACGGNRELVESSRQHASTPTWTTAGAVRARRQGKLVFCATYVNPFKTCRTSVLHCRTIQKQRLS